MGDEILLKEIGKRIHERRKELNLTQERLAEQMDVSIQMISNLELGKKAIRPENLVKICHVLEVSADYILLGKSTGSDTSELSLRLASLSPEDRMLLTHLIDRLERVGK